MFCQNCGKEIDDKAVVCIHCGCAVKGAKGNNGQKNWLVTLLLCLFLGCWGAHRFYVGKTGTAIAQLLLNIFGWATVILVFGLFILAPLGIWVFIDFIMICCNNFKDADGNDLEK